MGCKGGRVKSQTNIIGFPVPMTSSVILNQIIDEILKAKPENRDEAIKHLDEKGLLPKKLLKPPPSKPPGPSSRTKNRLSTTLSAAAGDVGEYFDKANDVEYTEKDELKKQEIFNYKPGYSAFSNNARQCDDHMFGKREGLQKYNMLGSQSKFNIIPCTHAENSSNGCWKNIPGSNKNIVYDINNFTEEEIENFDENTKVKISQVKAWIAYCKQRGAVLYYSDLKKADNERREIFGICHESMAHYTFAQCDGDSEWQKKMDALMSQMKDLNNLRK